jgi:uncharacterized DUF497 family protein
MEIWSFFWDDEQDPEGNIEHIAEHDLTVEDVEHVLKYPTEEGTSKSSGLPAAWGFTPDGRFIIVVYEEVAEKTVRVITAYEVPQRKRGRRK